ncbi:MAG: prepilin peptidase [Lachnospiraceae bacterium]|nr:prepilin peptidase [Ruminococcus sp.]MCM1276128.1 prepilin peptidase [Lachnospiraceae bacterium]
MPVVVNIVYAALAFVFGSVIGSFLNVVILRTPLKQSIVTEPSHCFSCGHRLAWYDMFPIFSWLFLRGKCRYCGEKISPRYMIIEAVTAVSYCLAYLVFGFKWELAFSAVLFAVLIVLSGIDVDHFEIPYWCSITVAVLGAASFLVFSETPWYERLIALGVIGVLFVILVLVGGMGGGDLQLMLGASLLLGYRVFIALFIGIVLGAVYGIVKKTRDKKAEKAVSEKIKELAMDWYQNQLDRDVGYVLDGHDDIIVGSISEGKPDIEWEFLEEKVWKGLPDKAALSQALRDSITEEREGGFKIFIKEDLVEKVKYSRRMVFGPFLAVGISAAWLIGNVIMTWYMSLLGIA